MGHFTDWTCLFVHLDMFVENWTFQIVYDMAAVKIIVFLYSVLLLLLLLLFVDADYIDLVNFLE